MDSQTSKIKTREKSKEKSKINNSINSSLNSSTSSENNSNIYTKVLLNQNINLEFNNINNNIKSKLEEIIKNKIEGKCIEEGFVKKESVKLLSFSGGELYSKYVSFQTLFECFVTNPVESMKLDCIVRSITKVGLRAELDDINNPFAIFIARDHHYNNELFSSIKLNDIIKIRVIGQRYELYDNNISIIAELQDLDNKKTLKNELIEE